MGEDVSNQFLIVVLPSWLGKPKYFFGRGLALGDLIHFNLRGSSSVGSSG